MKECCLYNRWHHPQWGKCTTGQSIGGILLAEVTFPKMTPAYVTDICKDIEGKWFSGQRMEISLYFLLIFLLRQGVTVCALNSWFSCLPLLLFQLHTTVTVNLFFKRAINLFFYFMCVGIVSACISVHHVLVCQWRPAEDVRLHGLEV